MPRALITGAGGFVGPYLARHLRDLGADVIGTTLTDERLPNIETRQLDIRDRDSVHTLVRDLAADEIYHLAALSQPNLADDDAYWDVNLNGTRHVLDAAHQTGAAVLVVSSAYVYGARSEPVSEEAPLRPMNTYGASKAAAEMAAIAASNQGAHVVLARPFNHTGPGQVPTFFVPTLVQQLVRIQAGQADPCLHLGDLTSIRDMSDVRDVVRAYPALLRGGASGEAYNVGSGTGASMRQIVDLARSLFEQDVDIQQDPDRLRPSDLPHLVADTTKLLNAIDWQPEYALQRTLEDMLTAATTTRPA